MDIQVVVKPCWQVQLQRNVDSTLSVSKDQKFLTSILVQVKSLCVIYLKEPKLQNHVFYFLMNLIPLLQEGELKRGY